MRKISRLFLTALFAAALGGPTLAAGTVPGFSLSPQFDLSGKLAPGCKLFIIQAGTTSTPQNAYQDTALTQVLPNPLTCDAAGRLGQFFVADGLIKVRLQTAAGVQITTLDNILVIGPSSGGGGGGGTIDPTTIFQTGAFMQFYGTGTLTGWVRANGRTIGSATSGATERANADTQALFVYLWGADANLAVSGGRGASAAADYAANKTITLPDLRGRAIAGLDDMGSSAAGRLTSTYFGASGTCLGCAGGAESRTLTLAQLPTGITSSGSNSITVGVGGTIAFTPNTIQNGTAGGGANGVFPFSSSNWTGISSISGTNSISVTSSNTSGAAHATASPMMLATIFLKL